MGHMGFDRPVEVYMEHRCLTIRGVHGAYVV